MNVALTRWAVRIPARLAERRPRTSDVGEVASKIVIVTLFSFMAMRLAKDAAATGHVTGILMLVSEALVVALTLVRRAAGSVDARCRRGSDRRCRLRSAARAA